MLEHDRLPLQVRIPFERLKAKHQQGRLHHAPIDDEQIPNHYDIHFDMPQDLQDAILLAIALRSKQNETILDDREGVDFGDTPDWSIPM